MKYVCNLELLQIVLLDIDRYFIGPRLSKFIILVLFVLISNPTLLTLVVMFENINLISSIFLVKMAMLTAYATNCVLLLLIFFFILTCVEILFPARY